MRQEARELQSKYGESSPGPEERDELRAASGAGPRLSSKRISVPENFSYFPAMTQPSLQTQLAHHRLNQKRQILQKQRLPVTGDLSAAPRRDRQPRPGLTFPRPWLPGACALGTPHTSDLFQPIAEDEPVADSPNNFSFRDEVRV